ncbi:type II toxin-antitoxin system RelE/ParE family toxin [Sutterella sp.]|uniref:type II toxin-antitoxin system RelE/ParE family toxin n=1 Tax=Sutterella sp. TaxID=1981025 RepID=UPI003FD7F464
MLTVSMTSKFRKDFKRVKRRNKDISKLHRVVELLSQEFPLDESYRDHALTGNYAGFRELHIEPDWLLIYCI